MLRTVVLSTGFHVPERVVANQDLTKQMETSDEKDLAAVGGSSSGAGRRTVSALLIWPKAPHLVCIMAFGSGFIWGSALIGW